MTNGGKLIINLPEGQEWQKQLEEAVAEVAKGYVREEVSRQFEREIERLVIGRVRSLLDVNSYDGSRALSKIVDKAVGNYVRETIDQYVKEALNDEKVENMIKEAIQRRIVNSTWSPETTINTILRKELNDKADPFLEDYVEKHIGDVVSRVLREKMK